MMSKRSRSSISVHQLAVAMRDRERADRAVRGHAPAVAEADDVALAGALRAVRAADDAHVVAALDEVLVEVADVGVDAARQREDVGRHEPDLHASAPRARPAAARSKRTGRARPPGYPRSRPVPSRRTMPRTSSRTARGVLALLPAEHVELLLPGVGAALPGRVAGGHGRAQVGRRAARGRGSRPLPTLVGAWASEPATAAMPSSSASAGARRLQRIRAVVGLKPSRASGW